MAGGDGWVRHGYLRAMFSSGWLSLLTPRRLLVPFCGSGSEIIGALRAGWDEVVGIEIEPEYIEIAEQRIYGDAPLWNVVTR